ncbi:D-Ala-D-Ala carboxypeptidase family metallohydrolase [Rapidithrix thailandica]|uniref:D-Ala-D-Ala carboxypeptidase family metallohydrolase n=1 Tax=Rapidithrix thailandica TaxID=413964 RepID=A0AAW9SA91_9BACT
MKYFQYSEFDSPDAPGSGRNMDPGFLSRLDKAREYSGIPFKINSGYRTRRYNAGLKNSVPDSAHVKGLAVDIGFKTLGQAHKILQGAIKAGFRRIGIGAGFIHLDSDRAKPWPAVWGYPTTNQKLLRQYETVVEGGATLQKAGSMGLALAALLLYIVLTGKEK